jgi:hypothetical protein
MATIGGRDRNGKAGRQDCVEECWRRIGTGATPRRSLSLYDDARNRPGSIRDDSAGYENALSSTGRESPTLAAPWRFVGLSACIRRQVALDYLQGSRVNL